MTRSLTLGALLLSLCFCARVAQADDAPKDASDTRPDYILVPGDVIDITVSSHTGYDRTVTIPPDGRMQFPSLKPIMAAGLTLDQLTKKIKEGLNAELIDPEVTISLKEINKGLLRRVSVLGAVKNPGIYELKDKSTLPEMLAAAGGILRNADLRHVLVTHVRTSQRVELDLSGNERTGTGTLGVTLEPGDLVLVPEGAAPTVTVLGEVTKPGTFDFQGEMHILDALSLAQGPTINADLQQVTLTRDGQDKPQIIDILSLFLQGGDGNSAKNIALRPGDTLVLPAIDQKFYVIGEVNKAQAFPLKPNTRLLDAITTAGGPTTEADLTKMVVVRKDQKGQPTGQRIDFQQMMKKGDLVKNQLLQAGDVVFVPSKQPKRRLQDSLGFLYPLAALATLF